jgi:hypothetical protein
VRPLQNGTRHLGAGAGGELRQFLKSGVIQLVGRPI